MKKQLHIEQLVEEFKKKESMKDKLREKNIQKLNKPIAKPRGNIMH